MGKLTFLCLHCTASPEGRVVTPDMIRKMHLSPPPAGRGWKQVGYSDMIMLDGSLVNLVKYNDDDNIDPWEITNGATGINRISRHIVYVGGVDKKLKAKDTRTQAQKDTMEKYVKDFIEKHPDVKVCGHYHFANKACPSFDVPKWLRSIGVDEKNIYEKEG